MLDSDEENIASLSEDFASVFFFLGCFFFSTFCFDYLSEDALEATLSGRDDFCSAEPCDLLLEPDLDESLLSASETCGYCSFMVDFL